jgi:hypothetical protein
MQEQSHKWKADDVGGPGVHAWLRRNYGGAIRCENREGKILWFPCSQKSEWYEWAFVNKVGHERRRELYMELCRSCHKKYDLN